MPMDALCLSAVLAETERNILGGRIDKIHQPSRDEILLHIRGKNGPCRLLLSANPSRARIQLTALPRENPAEPPMFCMLLRKYLSGGKILELRQPPAERLAELVIEATNEMGDKVRRRLILEMMGRRTNLLLLDGEDRCLLYEARPITCRLYGVPTAIGGQGHVCGFSAFEKGKAYPTVHLDKIQARLDELSREVARTVESRFSELHEVYVPLSMALITRYDEAYLGIGKAKPEE